MKTNNRKFRFSEKEKRFEEKNSRSRGRKNTNEEEKVIGNIRIRSMSKKELDLEYKQHVKKVKAKYEKMLQKGRSKVIDRDRYFDLKRCEVCTDFTNDPLMLFCDTCDDAYHNYCLDPPLEGIPQGFWECPKCIKERKKTDKDKSVQSTLKFQRSIKKIQKKCKHCKKNIKENAEGEKTEKMDTLKTCFKCQKDFHYQCFRSDWEDTINKEDSENNNKNAKNGRKSKSKSKLKSNRPNCKIICDGCEKGIMHSIKSPRISDYFKPDKNSKLKSSFSLQSHKKTTVTELDNRSVDSTFSSKVFKTPVTRSEGKLKLPKALTVDQGKTLKESLMRALLVKNIEFDDDLTYPDPNCPANMNKSSTEVGIQKISEYNKQIYYKFKERSREGEYAPLEIVDDDLQGFIVRATDDIPALTLICEYTGDVLFSRNRLFDKNDSMMDLIKAPSSVNSLTICPEKKGNIARFISGINNYDGKGIRKQNVKSIRYDIDGSVHVLLYSCKAIKKNDTLYYDYNAGGHEGYPTDQFI